MSTTVINSQLAEQLLARAKERGLEPAGPDSLLNQLGCET
jgi:hypothetical protein